MHAHERETAILKRRSQSLLQLHFLASRARSLTRVSQLYIRFVKNIMYTFTTERSFDIASLQPIFKFKCNR